jgi:hypothetical protein
MRIVTSSTDTSARIGKESLGALLREGKALLLDFADSKELYALSGRWKDRLQYVSTKAKDSKGVAAMLVRPDGFVAWASDSEPDLSAVEASIARWFGATRIEWLPLVQCAPLATPAEE